MTIAGLVIHEAQTIPEPGQTFTFHGYRFEILRRNKNRITAIRVRRLATDAGARGHVEDELTRAPLKRAAPSACAQEGSAGRALKRAGSCPQLGEAAAGLRFLRAA